MMNRMNISPNISATSLPQYQRRNHVIQWQVPSRGWVKCNYDASHHDGDQDSGMGWIIRNSNGHFLDCGMDKYQGRVSAVESECSALLWALQATWALGY
ncbi:unnamed protein product [Microthlaspi erraticum]|uniref:RNase H type-1 domain-containing protein n=1 Tax=Microthlaspi erraticum TaxID=1685480 RepID=A0A6D2J6E8_9BRAS|nr:unnamed protein product [Microthlaspi erraticum]